MAGGPYLPVLSLSRSQKVSLGHGPGSTVPKSLTLFDQATNPQTGALAHVFYADLSQGDVRRDLQRHSAIGGVVSVGSLTLSTWSDLYAFSGLTVSGVSSSFNVQLAAGTLQSRTFGTQLAVSAVNPVVVAAASAFDRTDLVVINSAGMVIVIQGVPALAAATYEVDTVTVTSGTTSNFKLAFTYSGFNYTTGTIAYNASAATVATAVLAATGGPALPASTLTGSGGALNSSPVTLTASGALEGAVSNFRVLANNTGGTVAYAQSTAGVGCAVPQFAGSVLPLAQVFVPSTATSSSNYTITTVAPTS